MSTDSSNFEFRTTPFAHQLEEWQRSRDEPVRAIFWEQGTGKSKLAIDTGAWLFEQGKIDCILVLAPKGVHRNWVVEELPTHLPHRVLERARMHFYETSRAGTKWHQSAVRGVLHHPGLAVLAISFDGLMTDRGRKAVWSFLRDRRCLYIADESRRIKTPGAKRTKRAIASARYAPYRRILNGTPVPNSPFDLYAQMKFLDEKFWSRHQIGSFNGFKTIFGILEARQTKPNAKGKIHSYVQTLGYRNLSRLKKIVDTVGTRVTKDDVLDLPPKLFSRATFQMEPVQIEAYTELCRNFIAFLGEEMECACGGKDRGCRLCLGEGTYERVQEVTAAMALVRMLRLQQITCGFVPPDDEGEPVIDLVTPNPRVEMLREIVVDLPHPAIIWARFRRDVDNILSMLKEEKLEAVRYDGAVKDADRARALDRFTSGKAQFFVANPAAAGEGLTLTQARTVIYYSNSHDLAQRLQSEDRAHRIGQEHPVHYIDLVASGTIDETIAKSLVDKFNIATQITGDSLRTMLEDGLAL